MSRKNNTVKPAALAPDAPADAGKALVPDTDSAAGADATTDADAGSTEVIAGEGSSASAAPAGVAEGAEVIGPASEADAPTCELGGEAGTIVAADAADELVKVKLLSSNHLGTIGEVVAVPWHHVADLEAAGLVDSHPASVGEE